MFKKGLGSSVVEQSYWSCGFDFRLNPEIFSFLIINLNNLLDFSLYTSIGGLMFKKVILT